MARKPRTKLEKFRAAEAWVRANFITPFPVKVSVPRQIEDEGCEYYGDCWREGRLILIRVASSQSCNHMIEVLFHEWSHAATLKYAHLEDRRLNLGMSHDDEFWLAFGRIYRAWFDQNGREDTLGCG